LVLIKTGFVMFGLEMICLGSILFSFAFGSRGFEEFFDTMNQLFIILFHI